MKRREFLATGSGVALTAIAGRSGAATRGRLLIGTEAGEVLGAAQPIELGRDICVRRFTGIPFAEPPVGPLRFTPPRPHRPWGRVFDARVSPASVPAPVQSLSQGGRIGAGQSEDCLRLDIWAPDDGDVHPVLVWIYGGGNIGGSIAQSGYDGRRFAAAGIVFVAANYREGVFGFVELGAHYPDYVGSGNNGIRDQVAALRWVRDNIRAFGGDPERVTLAGQSAGAGDCTNLLASRAARGMFHRVILASGGGGQLSSLPESEQYADAFLSELAAQPEGRGPFEATPADLLAAQHAAARATRRTTLPTLDGHYLTETPLDAIRGGAVRNVPILLGYNRDEFRAQASPEQVADDTFEHYRFTHFPPNVRSELIPSYAVIYPRLSPGDRNLRILSADWIKIGTTQIAEAQAGSGGAVFFYASVYGAPSGPFRGYCVHGADLPMDFALVDPAEGGFAVKFGYTPANASGIASLVHQAWVTFIRGEHLTMGQQDWPAYDRMTRRVMVVDQVGRIMDDPIAAEREVWKRLGVNI